MIDDEIIVFACPKCRSCDIQVQAWVHANTHATDLAGFRLAGCDTCECVDEVDGDLDPETLLQIPLSETREAKWLRERQQVLFELFSDDTYAKISALLAAIRKAKEPKNEPTKASSAEKPGG